MCSASFVPYGQSAAILKIGFTLTREFIILHMIYKCVCIMYMRLSIYFFLKVTNDMDSVQSYTHYYSCGCCGNTHCSIFREALAFWFFWEKYIFTRILIIPLHWSVKGIWNHTSEDKDLLFLHNPLYGCDRLGDTKDQGTNSHELVRQHLKG